MNAHQAQTIQRRGSQSSRRSSFALLNVDVPEEPLKLLHDVDIGNDGFNLYVPFKRMSSRRGSNTSVVSDITDCTFSSVYDDYSENFSKRRSSQLSQALDFIFENDESSSPGDEPSFRSTSDLPFGKRDSLLLTSRRGVRKLAPRDSQECDATFDTSSLNTEAFLERAFGGLKRGEQEDEEKDGDDLENYLHLAERRDSLFISQRRLRGLSLDINYYDESDDDDDEDKDDDLIVSWRTG